MELEKETADRQASGRPGHARWRLSLLVVVVMGAAALGAAAFLLGGAEKKSAQEARTSRSPAGATTRSSSSAPAKKGELAKKGEPAREKGAVLEKAPLKPGSIEVPEGMVYVPGGRTRIGIDSTTLRHIMQQREEGPRHTWGKGSTPAFWANVDSFFLEKHEVTVAQFRQFVEDTGFETQAEEFGNAGVMTQGRWQLIPGADWQHPRGPSAPKAPADHPVTQVSYNDAEAYCEWKGRRLPTEVEWEHAARGATNRRAYTPWGTRGLLAGGEYQANTWQGPFPRVNEAEDGYRYTAPVGSFGAAALGLEDQGGNVWEWTSSWYRPYPERGTPFTPTRQSEKVQRGGSFLCNECGGYRVFSRSHSTRETSLFHVGFRCAQDASRPPNEHRNP